MTGGIVVLAGGTGGAKLARGMLSVVGGDRLAVIANTADDIVIHGVHVSPDPDLVTWWLADLIDERGWGIAGDTWEAMDARGRAGDPAWFRLGDRDLAMCAIRTQALARDERLTEAHARVVEACGAPGRVLPMADEPVRTQVRTAEGWRGLQEFLIRCHGAEPLEVRLDGIEAAQITVDVAEVIAAAEVIVIGPSNPIISIGPILRVPGIREAIDETVAPVVAVSPFVAGRAIKGPTDTFCRAEGMEIGAVGIARRYSNLIDGLICDEDAPAAAAPTLTIDTLMDTPAARERVAGEVLEFAVTLRP